MSAIETLLSRLPSARQLAYNSWRATCPNHHDDRDDSDAESLSIAVESDGKLIIMCKFGCTHASICSSLNLSADDLSNVEVDPAATLRFPVSPLALPESSTFPTSEEAIANLELRYGPITGSWTYPNAKGDPVGMVVCWAAASGVRSYRQLAVNSGNWSAVPMAAQRPLYRLPELLNRGRKVEPETVADPFGHGIMVPAGDFDGLQDLVILADTEEEAEAARSLGLIATTAAGGLEDIPLTDWSPLAGRVVWIVRRNDDSGPRFAEAVMLRLQELRPSGICHELSLPSNSDGGGLVEWMAEQQDDPCTSKQAMLLELGKATAPSFVQPRATRPEIVISSEEMQVNDLAAEALGSEPDLFQRGRLLVYVADRASESESPNSLIRRPDTAPTVRELSRPLLRERLTRCAAWKAIGRDNQPHPAHPPKWCISAVHSRGEWPAVRRLEALVTHPVVLKDGSLLFANGYDPATGLFVQLPSSLSIPVPGQPTRTDVANAVAALNDVLVDFPFETEAHRAAWFAALLTPLAWFAFEGPAPLFLVDGNVRGIGKGLLADVISLIVSGRTFATMSYTNDREELRKKITSVAIACDRVVLFDNVDGKFGNDVLDMALTSTLWMDRVLGGNRVFEGPLHVCWYATGNNVQLNADTSRRVCHCRMETSAENPEKRSGFRHEDLRMHVRENRGKLLAAGITILRGWFAAGCPRHQLRAWGSYESWSSVVREAIVFAGLPDPGETREALQSASDPGRENMSSILRCLVRMDPAGRGLTVAEIVDKLKTPPASGEDWHSEMKAAVVDLCGRLDVKDLTYAFRSAKRRNFDGMLLDNTGKNRNKTNRWGVSRLQSSTVSQTSTSPPPSGAGDAGDAGDDSGRCDSADPTPVPSRQDEPVAAPTSPPGMNSTA